MSRIIALTNQKGGVGKTSLCWNLAVFLAKRFHKKILVIDLDTQGNISHTLVRDSKDEIPFDAVNFYGCQTKMLFDPKMSPEILKPMRALHEVDLVYTEPNDLSLTKYVYQKVETSTENSVTDNLKFFIRNVKYFAQNYEYVLIDCPPFIGQHILAALMVCDYVINPIQPTSYVMDGTKGFFENLRLINRTQICLGLILNNVDHHWVRHVAMENVLKQKYQELVFTSTLHHRAPFDAAIYLNKPLWENPYWEVAATEAENFVRETIKRIDAREGVTTSLEI